jgi:hypothetical protein
MGLQADYTYNSYSLNAFLQAISIFSGYPAKTALIRKQSKT